MSVAAPEAEDLVADARQRRLILITMCIALAAVIAAVSSLNVAQQAFAFDLHATQSQLLWIINSYSLLLAALLMPVGAIGDRWGRKPVLLCGLSLFAIANLGSAFVTSANQLIGLRLLAGMAAAMIMPVTLSVVTTSFPAHERARAVGVWSGVAGGGGILGLFISAAIIDHATWPWVFAVPVTLAVLALIGAVVVVPHSREHSGSPFDIAGSVLSVLAVGGIVLAIQEGPERGWSQPLTLVGIGVGVVALLAFVRVELHKEQPLIDLRVFRNRQLSTGSLNLFVVFALIFAVFLILVQLLQAVLGYSALRAASGILPMAVLLMPLSTVAPTIAERVGYRRTATIGMALIAIGMALMALLTDDSRGYLSVLPGLMVIGLGVGLTMSPATTAITNSLPEHKQGVASALNDTVREMGGAVGIALLGSVLNAQYRRNVSEAAAALPPEMAAPVKEGIGGALAVAGKLGEGGRALLVSARSAWTDAMRPALLIGAGIAVVAAGWTAMHARADAPADEAASGEVAPATADG